MTNGTKVPINTSSTFGNSPMPNHMITMGIQAMGGMGRMTSNMLPKNALHFLFHPMRMPKEIPTAHAISSAMSTRLKLAHACPAREVFAMGLVNVFTKRAHTSAGAGISSGRLSENKTQPTAIIRIANTGRP